MTFCESQSGRSISKLYRFLSKYFFSFVKEHIVLCPLYINTLNMRVPFGGLNWFCKQIHVAILHHGAIPIYNRQSGHGGVAHVYN